MYIKHRNKVLLSCILLFILLIQLTGCSVTLSEDLIGKNLKNTLLMKEAVMTPYGKYPQQITYTLGKMTGSNRSNMPEGDTYENNVYTRYLEEILNVKNINVYEESGEHYNNRNAMAVSENNIPDIMIINDLNILNSLVENGMLADLTKAYENCASEKIKEMYDSYDGRALDIVTFDNKIMAIPGVNIEYGPNLLWLRKDWLEKLGLKEPKNIKDVEHILKNFVEQDPGDNGDGNTIGMMCALDLTGNYDIEYQMDIVFASFGAFPKKWIRTEDGTVTYGSVSQEAKEALKLLQKWYRDGLLDNHFVIRTNENIHEEIIKGRCGAFFRPWWAPNNPLMQSYAENENAEWMPYLIPTQEDGSCVTYRQPASNKYVVVRRGFEHPELVMKVISVLFDYERFIDKDKEKLQEIYDANLDPTARPIVINVDYNDAYFRTSEVIRQVLDGETETEELSTLEYSYYELCKSYLSKDKPRPEEWAAYISRVTAADLLENNKIGYKETMFEGQTKTMQSKWWSLKQLENDAYLKIITGTESIDYFDEFVEQWMNQGGETVTGEVNEYLGTKDL